MKVKNEWVRNLLILVIVTIIVLIIVAIFSHKDAAGCPKKMAATQESSVVLKRFRGGVFIVSEENWTSTLVPVPGAVGNVA